MYLIDTPVIREAGRGSLAHAGVRDFFEDVQRERSRLFLAAVTVGELSRVLALMRQRGEESPARQLEDWLRRLMQDHGESLLALDARAARLWGLLLARHPQQVIALQIAAIAVVHDLTLVTRLTPVLGTAGVRVRDPWAAAG